MGLHPTCILHSETKLYGYRGLTQGGEEDKGQLAHEDPYQEGCKMTKVKKTSRISYDQFGI